MTKQDYISAMKQAANGADFITLSEISGMLGVKKADKARKYVTGLTRLSNKYYFIPEVADKMMDLTK